MRIIRVASPAVAQRAVGADHRDLEDVGGRPLHGRVLRHALPHLTDAEVVRRQLGDLAAAAEDRGRVPTGLRLDDRPLHVRVHVREGLEVAVEDLACLVRRDVEPLTEAVGLHAVREPVVDDLGEPALEVVDLRLVDAEHLRGGDRVDVGASGERVDQTGVLREMGEDAQLDLGVVGGHEAAALVGDERLAHLTPLGGTDGNVLEVGALARDASGGGGDLVEGGVDAAVGLDERRQRVGVGGTELLDLAVLEEVGEDRVLRRRRHLLEGVRVGRRAGLGALDRCELEHLEQDVAELGHRVDDERLAGVRVDLGLQLVALLLEVGAHLVEELAVDAYSDVLHLGEHADERALDVLVQGPQLARLECASQRVSRDGAPRPHGGRRRRPPASPSRSSVPSACSRSGDVELEAAEAGTSSPRSYFPSPGSTR